MKRPTPASLKRVNTENLKGLGLDRLAEILMDVGDARPEVKRRLRMELAAEQGAEHLWLEIDKRIATVEASRAKVSWRKRPTFVGELSVLRELIADRLGPLDAKAAAARMLAFLELWPGLILRVKDKDGELEAIFAAGAANLGALAADADLAAPLVEAMIKAPGAWSRWLPAMQQSAPPDLAQAALRLMSERRGAAPSWFSLLRQLSDAAMDVDAYLATFSAAALREPQIAAQAAQRLLAAGRIAQAGKILKDVRGGQADFDHETALIDYLEAAGEKDAAQAARWTSFERTLSADRARAFTKRLADFDDVEAEERAFAHAARHPDFEKGLKFLIEWPAYPEAARMITSRADEIAVPADEAQTWAARLSARQPAAAEMLLRKAAAAAYRRREYAACDRLTAEADALGDG